MTHISDGLIVKTSVDEAILPLLLLHVNFYVVGCNE